MDNDMDETTYEIEQLILRLDPRRTSHKDRVRALTRFRNFVSNAKNSPEFYDDDIPLLLLGTKDAPDLSASIVTTMKSNMGGLIHACGVRSEKKDESLKRSCRTAMNLLKYLVLDFVEKKDGQPTGEENLFSSGFLESCTKQHYLSMELESHIMEDSSSRAAKEDACELLCLLLLQTNNNNNNNNNNHHHNLTLMDLLPSSAKARSDFEKWVTHNKPKQVQLTIQKLSGSHNSNVLNSKAKKQQAAAAAAAAANHNNDGNHNEDGEDDDPNDILGAFTKRKVMPSSTADDDDSDNNNDKSSDLRNSLLMKSRDGPPIIWADSQLAQEDQKRVAAERELEYDKTERESELKRQEEEKQRLLRKDPLGIRTDLDLLAVQENWSSLLDDMVEELENELDKEHHLKQTRINSSSHHNHNHNKLQRERDQLTSLEAQRDSLDDVLEGRSYITTEDESKDLNNRSLLPTDKNFDPLLFLTLVHRDADFNQLQKSIERISNKTDNQMQNLQNLVRDNFALFVRCADNIDLFSKDKHSKRGTPSGVRERLDHLEFLAGSCANQAKSSFKPLLDNTNEVRKVQSALAVLQRIAPLLQIPFVMRQHMENGRFSQAIKSYRSIFAIKDDIQMELLQDVKKKAIDAAEDVRRDLETTLANPNIPIQTLLDTIRDLDELIELESQQIQHMDNNNNNNNKKQPLLMQSYEGQFTVGGETIQVRKYPPALACLLLQTAHFSQLVNNCIRQSEISSERIYAGETLACATTTTNNNNNNKTTTTEENNPEKNTEEQKQTGASTTTASTATETYQSSSADSSSASSSNPSVERRERNRWKYDILEARVVATIRTVAIARTWLPRLLGISVEAHEAEKRSLARRRNRRRQLLSDANKNDGENNMDKMTFMDVIHSSVDPTATKLIQHAAFCALGCLNHSHDNESLRMTYGMKADERLQGLLKAPLPPAQSAKCATGLAVIMKFVKEFIASAGNLKPASIDDGIQLVQSNNTNHQQPLEECRALAEDAVVTMERRRCIYAFDICARNCSMRASGSGTLDGDALLLCVQRLGEELTHPEECANEVEKGCEIVVKRCCEGLATYVRARGDTARLRAVAECASALDGRMIDVVREIRYLTDSEGLSLEEVLIEEIMTLEGILFEQFLDNLRTSVGKCARLQPDYPIDSANEGFIKPPREPPFAAYLSASLLAIVRCRAQVGRALGAITIRRSQASTYQFLAMSTAADSVVDSICFQLKERQPNMTSTQADKYSNELQFLVNTLKAYLSDQSLDTADDCRAMLLSLAGRKGGFHGDGPDGLDAIEELERLGRVYVLCLGE